jgi:hypothetical protein
VITKRCARSAASGEEFADQRDSKGKLLRDKLAADLAKLEISANRIKFKGDPKGLRI